MCSAFDLNRGKMTLGEQLSKFTRESSMEKAFKRIRETQDSFQRRIGAAVELTGLTALRAENIGQASRRLTEVMETANNRFKALTQENLGYLSSLNKTMASRSWIPEVVVPSREVTHHVVVHVSLADVLPDDLVLELPGKERYTWAQVHASLMAALSDRVEPLERG